MEDDEKDFKLIKFSLEFEKGYDWEKDPEKQKDRYEGQVKFRNGESEEFVLNVDNNLSLQIVKLIVDKLAENTESLVKNINNCIINAKQQEK